MPNWLASLGPLALAILLAGCVMLGFRPGWSIEPPPQQYASGPTQTGHTTELRVTPEGANYLCHTASVWTHEPQGFPVACYNPKTDQIILPSPWPSNSEVEQMRAHEMAHARGWRHTDDGTGTGPTSIPPLAQQLAPPKPVTAQAQSLANALVTPPVRP